MSLIADLAWIKRGIAKAVPDKVKLSTDEIRNLLQDGEPETSEFSETDDAMEGDVERRRGIRGSNRDVTDNEGSDGHEEHDETSNERPNAMAGIAMFATPLDDPHISVHVDSDEEDREDFEIKPDDNLVVAAKINKNEYNLEIYLYNEAEDDWYVHHDYILDAPPLCVEPISFDPGSDDKKGNLLAVGDINANISIWDLDLVNSVEPLLNLGNKKTKKRSRRKRDGSAQRHTDAVLSLAWNRSKEHILASGSADNTIILWDIEDAKPASIATYFNGKVQAIEWHPVESSFLLAGTLSKLVGITDCRVMDGLSRKWEVSGEVEQLIWDHFNPFYFFVTTDDGYFWYMDTRKNEPLISKKAHEGGARCVTQSFFTKGLLSTCGADRLLKIWRLQESQNDVDLLTSQTLNLDSLHVCRFSPDSGNILVVGGEKEEMIKIVDVSKFEDVRAAFS